MSRFRALRVIFWSLIYHPLDWISTGFDWLANKAYARLWFAANPTPFDSE